jgi:hypothetical protein
LEKERTVRIGATTVLAVTEFHFKDACSVHGKR